MYNIVIIIIIIIIFIIIVINQSWPSFTAYRPLPFGERDFVRPPGRKPHMSMLVNLPITKSTCPSEL